MKRIVLVIILVFAIFNSAAVPAYSAEFGGVRRNLATIILCGLGGAVIGISTLSFYGNPQEHIGNITTGLALGTIGGVVYVTTQNTKSGMSSLDIHDQKMQRANRDSSRPLFVYNWNF